MTVNQVAYWNLQEAKRHNRETEDNAKALTRGQLKRWNTQSGTDIANAVTGGIKNIGSGFKDITSGLTTVSNLANLGKAATGLIGFGG